MNSSCNVLAEMNSLYIVLTIQLITFETDFEAGRHAFRSRLDEGAKGSMI